MARFLQKVGQSARLAQINPLEYLEMRLTLLATVALIAVAAGPAHAALTTYKGSGLASGASDAAYGSFLGQLLTSDEDRLVNDGGVQFFEPNSSIAGFNGGAGPWLFGNSALSNSDNSARARLTGSGTFNETPIPATNDGRTPFPGSVYLEGGLDSFSVEFNDAVRAFGFWGTDIGDFLKSGTECDGTDPNCQPTSTGADVVLELRVQFEAAVVAADLVSGSGCRVDPSNSSVLICDIGGGEVNGSQSFWGITATSGAAIDKVTFTNKGIVTEPGGRTFIADVQGFRGFVTGTVELTNGNGNLPEPTSLLLAALGLTGVLWRRRSAAAAAQA